MKIYAFAAGGLANRMQCIDSGVALARRLDCEIATFWMKNNELYAEFHELFQPIRGLEIITERPWHAMETLRARQEDTLIVSTEGLRSLPVDPEFWASYNYGSYCNIVFQTNARFCYSYRGETVFHTNEALQAEIDRQAAKAQGRVGVHIRRTDNNISIDQSPTDAFTRYMDGVPDERFFLCTDDPEEAETLSKRYPRRIATPDDRTLRRDLPEGIKAAVVDLMLLAQTKYIVGSAGSSYSLTAAYMGRIPLHIARKWG